MARFRVLVVDDKPSMLEMLKTILSPHYQVSVAKGAEEGLAHLNRSAADVVISDIRMPGMDGLEFLRAVKKGHPGTDVILMTAFGEIPQAVEAMKAGAYHYLTKPFEPDLMVKVLDRCLEHKELVKSYESLKQEVETRLGFGELVGKSESMREAFDLIGRAAAVDANVLITGETGTGKELVSRAIHRESARRNGPFVVVHCAGVPRELMESELFGHARGAFTGATSDKKGQAETADGGTLLLDDVNYLPMDLQAKANRLVQEKEIKPVGSNDWRKVDVRILATSNVSLKTSIQEGKFREDLFFRLSVVTIQIPPLRERREDIPLLVRHFVEKHAKKIGRKIDGVAPEALQLLTGYPWPGNVRELENVVERAIILSPSSVLQPEQFRLESPGALSANSGIDLNVPYGAAIESASEKAAREYVIGVLRMFGGNVTKAATHAGIERQSMHRLMKRYGIKVDREVEVEE